MNFNAKNLSYGKIAYPTCCKICLTSMTYTDPKEPAFLRKLRNEQGRDPHRQERPHARPKGRLRDSDDDDRPTYVVEDSHDTFSKEEYAALLSDAGPEKQEDRHGSTLQAAEHDTSKVSINQTRDDVPNENLISAKEQVAAIGGSIKRRYPKVIGDESEDAKRLDEDAIANGKRLKSKKGRKIKLSFNEESG